MRRETMCSSSDSEFSAKTMIPRVYFVVTMIIGLALPKLVSSVDCLSENVANDTQPEVDTIRDDLFSPIERTEESVVPPSDGLNIAFPPVVDLCLPPPPILETKLGKLLGSCMTSQLGRRFLAFRGIPYAKPPLGNLRFKLPAPMGGWKGVLDASREGPVCIQPEPIIPGHIWGQENCLILNVYMPTMPKKGSSLPVMFFIHGGGFVLGAGNTLFSGPRKLLDKDIILVTFNYRLGALGFLSTGDEVCSGNWALHDQVLALEWVYDNIADYGGNPDEITIFGESAGAASVQYLMLYPRLEGKFKRVIMESGSVLISRLVTDRPLPEANRLAEKLNCPTSSSQEMIDCLREKPAKDIIRKGTDTTSHLSILYPKFPPVIEKEGSANAFLTTDPEILLKEGKFHKGVTVISGVNRNEMAIAVQALYLKYNLGIYDPTFIDRHLQKAMGMILGYNSTEAYNKLVAEYFAHINRADESQFRKAFIDAFSDGFFKYPNNNSICYMSKYVTTYMYTFEYRGSFSLVLAAGNLQDHTSCGHADDLLYLFDGHGNLYGTDLKVSKNFLNLWVNFSTNGNPTPRSVEVEWKPTTCEENRYLRIAKTLTMHQGCRQEKMSFWTEQMKPHEDDGLIP